jgi:hypothetical protein
MSLPTPIRTWKYQVNNRRTFGANITLTCQDIVYALKTAIIGGGSWKDSANASTTAPSGWTVAASSDSTNASFDGTDRWTASTALVWSSSTVHSWIVLRHTTYGDLLIDLNGSSASPYQLTMKWAPPSSRFGTAAGGTNGTTSAAPTTAASGSITLFSAAACGLPQTATNDTILHVLQATTGGLQIVMCRNGWPVAFYQILAVDGSVLSGAQWTDQIIVRFSGTNTVAPSSPPGISADTPNTAFTSLRSGTQLTLSPLVWGSAAGDTTLYSESAHSILGANMQLPVGLYCTTASNIGVFGFVPDCYFVTNGVRNVGFPDDTAPTWASFSNNLIPWNTSTPVYT